MKCQLKDRQLCLSETCWTVAEDKNCCWCERSWKVREKKEETEFIRNLWHTWQVQQRQHVFSFSTETKWINRWIKQIHWSLQTSQSTCVFSHRFISAFYERKTGSGCWERGKMVVGGLWNRGYYSSSCSIYMEDTGWVQLWTTEPQEGQKQPQSVHRDLWPQDTAAASCLHQRTVLLFIYQQHFFLRKTESGPKLSSAF